MRSGHTSLRPRCRALLVVAALVPLAGCNTQYSGYDEKMSYPVRTDLIVAPGTWEIQPTKFNHPGILPLDAVSMPDAERSADTNKLREFLGKKLYDPTTLPPAERGEYAKQLEALFGTPAHPKVAGFDPAALKASPDDTLTESAIVEALKLDEKHLTDGSRYFRQQCLHCHGMEGNGRGPTGPWVNPPPRDYRQGIFKYTSSAQDQNARKPRREDVRHVLDFGVEGTSMPSFNILSDYDREALVSYVIHLSIRGQVEYMTMADQLALQAESKGAEGGDRPKYKMNLREDLKNPTLKDAMQDNLALIAARWVEAQKPDKAIIPTPYPDVASDAKFLESAGRGGKIFLGAGGCISCHQNFGRESNLVYDAWGTIIRGRNLYDGIYRGGRRPVDLYNRIHGGIEGAGMTAYKDLKNSLNPQDLGLNAEQLNALDPLWDIVTFLRALPHRDLRDKLRSEPYKLNLPE